MAVTVTQLVAFVTAVRRGSVSAAAEELVVTQPSVSAAINALQRELGVTLMERSGRSLRPTAAGKAYAPYAADILGLIHKGGRAAREAEGTFHRKLRIGAVTTAGEYVVAPLLRVFRDAHPELEVVLHVGNRGDIFQRLLAHEIDVAITGRLPADLPLHAQPFASNDFLLITARGDELTKRWPVAAQDLARRPWLVRESGSGTRAVSDEYLAAHRLQPEILTLGSNGAIKQAVAVGLGVSLQSSCAIQLELQSGMLATIQVRDGLPKRAWYVTHSAIGPVRPEVVAFVVFVQTRAAQYALARAWPPAAT